MTEQAFASVWGLSYSDFEFLNRFGAKSQVMLACQLLFFCQQGLSPLIYLHINPYGRFEVDLEKRIDFERMAA